MKLKPSNLRDLYVALKAKAAKTNKPVTVTLFINGIWDLKFEDDKDFRATGYLYIARPDGTLICHMLNETRDKKTGTINSHLYQNVEFIYEDELKQMEFTGFKYEEETIKSFTDLSKRIGIQLVTVSSKIPLNLKYHFDQLTTDAHMTQSEVLRGLIEEYTLQGLIKKARILMYQKPHMP